MFIMKRRHRQYNPWLHRAKSMKSGMWWVSSFINAMWVAAKFKAGIHSICHKALVNIREIVKSPATVT